MLWAGAGAEGEEEGSSRMVGHCFVVGGMATGGEVIEEEEGRRGGGLAEAPVAVVLKKGRGARGVSVGLCLLCVRHEHVKFIF